ncbi:hypothetical protein OHB93_14525 [Microbacterium sp. No. 7]|uniref:hypothetical protein n=1 Tax=Microbacterium sp. No. 7 TaxID=1714373 RepID=UPI00300918DD
MGARAFDDAEADALADSPITRMTADALADTEVLADAVTATGADAVYVHIDLDVLDPRHRGPPRARPVRCRPGSRDRLPRTAARADAAGRRIDLRFRAGDPDAAVEDLGTILRLVGAVA